MHLGKFKYLTSKCRLIPKLLIYFVYRNYVPQNNLPLGIDVQRDRLFVTMPRWKQGVPASLGWLPLPATESSPLMNPYPNWEAHSSTDNPDCSKMMSVYRIFIDECERLWILDAGIVNATILPNPICPPKIVVYDLKTDRELFQYEIPESHIKEDSLFTNIIVDIRDGQCNDAYAYITDVWRYSIVVFSLRTERSWRTTNHFYQPTPAACDYTLHGLNFQWNDGVFGISLSPPDAFNERTLFFHPMSSYTVRLTICEHTYAIALYIKHRESFISGIHCSNISA